MDAPTPPSGDDETRAEMSAADINDLPDDAFAYIEPGGEKDDEGKTTPRSLRHFPVHDEAHVRNALSRAPQSPFWDKAMPKIKAAAKKLGIDTDDIRGQSAQSQPHRRKQRHRAVPLAPEVRFFAPQGLEVRSATDTDEIIITGQPIIYGAPYAVVDMFGEFKERMHPGCVSELLDAGTDTRLLLNHAGLPMARTTSGTLRLWDTAEALHFEARLDARQQLSNDFAIAIQRGDLNQMSVGMIVGQDEWGWEGEVETRDVFKLNSLPDVSGVTYPCSPTTHIEVAYRMMMERPVESLARVRRLAVEARAGRVLSVANATHLQNAHAAIGAVLEAGGYGSDVNDGDADDVGKPTVERHPAEGDGGPDLTGLVSEDGSVGGGTVSQGVSGDADASNIGNQTVRAVDWLRIQFEARKRSRPLGR